MLNTGERNELIQSAKSRFYYATRFQKPKYKDAPSVQDSARVSTSLFMLTPTESLASLAPTDSKRKTAADRAGIVPWPNVKEYYELLEIVGVGTTAQVYSAFCTPRKEKCAIKLVDLKKWPLGLEDLLKDVQAMTTMNHPNLVTYYTAFADRDELWLVLQYMELQSLQRVIYRKLKATNCKRGVFDEATIATIMTGVLSGLDFIHSNGYIHRDIKAENILLSSSGNVQIADFSMTNCSAKTRTFVGSPCWLAPEIIEDPDHKYSSKADTWSLGITAIEMATGYPPYHKNPTMKVLMLILLHESPSLETDAEVRDQYKKYGKTFRSLISDCLNKNPSKRPSATQLLFHPFFKKTRDENYLLQVFSAIPPDLEVRFKKPPVEEEPMYKQRRGEWIPAPEELIKPDQIELPNREDTKRQTTTTYDSVKTTPSLKAASGAMKPSKITNISSLRGLTHVYDFILKIRGLHLDTPMILKTDIRKGRELFDIKFSYYVERDTPESVASDLVREGLIDARDRIPVATNLKNLVKAGVLNSVTFPLISDISSSETPSEWRLIGYASLSVVSIRTTSGQVFSRSSSSTNSSTRIKTLSH